MENDGDLQGDLRTYVKQNLRGLEILDFVKEKYPNYQWGSWTIKTASPGEAVYINSKVNLIITIYWLT
jgi:hypothetical protein